MQYLIWSNEHRGWWKANRHGYTTRTDKAGHFSFEEARRICTDANRYLRNDEPRNELLVFAPSPDQIKLDMEHSDR